MSDLRVRFLADTTGFSDGLRRAEGGLEGFADRADHAKQRLADFGRVAAQVSAAAAAAVAGFATKSVAEFAAVDTGMREVFTLLPDISGEAMGDMQAQVLDLSREVGKLPSEVIPALYQSISAGVPQETVFDFMRVASEAAVGGVTTLETAVDGISSAVNAYGAESLSAQAASDLMFTAVRLGKTDFTQLSRSLFNVIPTAANLGIEFGEVTAALAAMTAQGTPTSVATTQLRQLFTELARSSTPVYAAFQDITGESFPDFIAGGGTVQQALAALADDADEKGLRLADVFGSVEAANAAMVLTGESGAAAFANALDEMDTSAGATGVAYDRMAEGIGMSFARMRSAFSVTMVQVGERLAPIFQEATDVLVRDVFPLLEEVTVAAFEALAGAVEWMRDTVEAALDALSAATGLSIGEMGDVVLGVVDDFAAFAEQVAEWLVWVYEDVILPIVEDLAPVFERNFAAVMEAVGPILESLGNLFRTAFEVLRTVYDNIVAPVMRALLPLFEGIFRGILKAVAPAMDTIEALLRAFGAFVSGDFVGVMDALGDAVESAFGALIAYAAEALAGFAASVATVFGEMKDNALAWGRDIVDGFTEGITGAFGRAREGVESLASNVVGWFKDVLGISSPSTVFYEMASDIVTGLLDGIRGMANAARDAVTSFAGNISGWFRDVLGIQSPSTVFAAFGRNIVEGFRVGVDEAVAGDLQASVAAFAESAITWARISLGLDSGMNPWEEMGTAVVDGLKDGIEAAVPGLLDSLADGWARVEAFNREQALGSASIAVPLPAMDYGSEDYALPGVGDVGGAPDVSVPELLLAPVVETVQSAADMWRDRIAENAELERQAAVIRRDTAEAQALAEAQARDAQASSAAGVANAGGVGMGAGAGEAFVAELERHASMVRSDSDALAAYAEVEAAAAERAKATAYASEESSMKTKAATDGLGGALTVAVAHLQRWRTAVGEFADRALASAREAIPALDAAISGFATGGPLGALAAVFGELLLGSEGFKRMLTTLSGALEPLVDAVDALFVAFAPIIDVAVALVKTALAPLVWVIEHVVAPVFAFVANLIRGIWNGIARVINATLGRLFNFEIALIPSPDEAGGDSGSDPLTDYVNGNRPTFDPPKPSTPPVWDAERDLMAGPAVALTASRSDAAPVVSTAMFSATQTLATAADTLLEAATIFHDAVRSPNFGGSAALAGA